MLLKWESISWHKWIENTWDCRVALLNLFCWLIKYQFKRLWKQVMENYAKFPILSNRQIYPEASRKTSPQKDFNGSTNSLNSDSNYGSRKFLNLIHEGQKFCLVQGDQQGKKNRETITFLNFWKIWEINPVKWLLCFENPFSERPHRSMGRSGTNWPFRSQSIDRNQFRRSVQVLMSESNTSLNNADDLPDPVRKATRNKMSRFHHDIFDLAFF